MSDTQPQIAVTDRFEPEAMQAFRRRSDLFWEGADALSPPPESLDFIAHMLHPDVWTVAGVIAGHIFGFVEFNKRTSIGAEIHVGFHPQFRGRIARAVTLYAIGLAFKERGLLKLWAPIPSDHKAALMAARLIGFRQEGRLTRAIVRRAVAVDGSPPLADLVLMSLSKETHQ